MIEQYTVIASQSYVSIAAVVGEKIATGFVPLGGIAFDGHNYLQAMVKYQPSMVKSLEEMLSGK